jgi:putative membrane protein
MLVEVPENAALAWSFPPVPFFSLLLAEVIYLRGWQRARLTRPEQLPIWRAVCFTLGIASVWIALASPIDALDDLLLLSHMTQHLILMSVAPPLLLLGAPAVPMLRGLPRFVVRGVAGPLLRAKWFQKIVHVIRHPLFGWLSMNIAYVGWHVPANFELALRSEGWHSVEHACFFYTSIAFWWTIVQPWPSHRVWPRWVVIPYLISADLVNTGVSAFLDFNGKVLYPTYAQAPRVYRISALDDQIGAGAEMWVLGSIIFLVAATIRLFQLLNQRQAKMIEPVHAAHYATQV